MAGTDLRMDMLRFATAGSVDDGKSTLIGRLLVDTRQVLEDQLDALERSRRERGREEIAASRITERGETRADDRTSEAAMEDRKREGYF